MGAREPRAPARGEDDGWSLGGSGRSAIVTNPDRSAAVWSFLVDRLDALARSAAGTALLGLLLQNAVPLLGLTRPAEMRAWVAGRTFPESEVAVTKGLDLLEVFTRTVDRTRGTGRGRRA